MFTRPVRLVPYCAVILSCLLLSSSPGLSQKKAHARNVLLDSIAWVAQEIPLPGVIGGSAIWFDYNSDGRLDILMAGMSQLGAVSGVYRNDSTGFTNLQANICPLIPERGIAWADFDNDGDLDFAIEGRATPTSLQAISKVYACAADAFTDVNAQIMNLNGGSVTWVDYDNDGRLDLLVSGSPDQGRSFYTKLYRRIQGQFYEVPTSFPGVWGSSIAWNDYDKDGFIDVMLTGYGYGQQTHLFHNAMSRGVIGFDRVDAPIYGGGLFITVNSGAVLWMDYDNDGYSDLLICGVTSMGAETELYRNNGSGQFTPTVMALKGLCVSAAAAGDYDNDGYLDLALSGTESFSTGANPTTKIYHNNGNGSFTDIGATLAGTWNGSLDWGDYDRDGRLDLLVTGGTLPLSPTSDSTQCNPVTILYRNTVLVPGNTPPAVPQGLAVQVRPEQAVLSWNASTDAETDQPAITYNIMVGTQPGRGDVVSPLSSPESGFRRMPKPGNRGALTTTTLTNLPLGTYYWKVQAVDNQLAGSAFSQEGSFTVSTSSVDPDNPSPLSYLLEQNFPNPFNPSTTIRYQIPERSEVQLAVSDLLGREVALLVNETKGPGSYAAIFDGTGLASGIYYCRLQAGDFVQTRKVVLMK